METRLSKLIKVDSQLTVLSRDLRKGYDSPWPIQLRERIDMLLDRRLELMGGVDDVQG